MVQRLKASQMRQIVRDLIPQGLLEYRIPEPVSGEAVEKSFTEFASARGGRCYGWFDSSLTPRGVLVGMIRPDPMTGVLHGFEFAWWAARSHRGKPALELARAFEIECRESGCKRITFGYSHHQDAKRMQKLYRRLGFWDYNTSVSKEI